MLADGAMPMVPVQAGPRSERMSPNRLEATTTSNQSGAHEVGGEDVDVVLVGAHVRIALRHFGEALVPVGHGDRDAVRLGGRGQVPLRPRHRQLEGELHDAVGAAAGEDAFLDHGFALGAFEHAPPTLEYSPSVFSRTT
jgi:hypothetical protein